MFCLSPPRGLAFRIVAMLRCRRFLTLQNQPIGCFVEIPTFIWSIWLPYLSLSVLPLFSSVSSSSSSLCSSLPPLTRRPLVNPLPVFSLTHPLPSLKPFRAPKNLGRFFSLSAPAAPPPSTTPPPSYPPTHTDSPPLTPPPPVFFGDCICVLLLAGVPPRDLRSVDVRWRPKKTARRRERSASVSIHPLILAVSHTLSRRQSERQLGGGRASQFVSLPVFLVPEPLMRCGLKVVWICGGAH